MNERDESGKPAFDESGTKEKDTSEESQYDEKSGEDHPGPKDEGKPHRPEPE